MNTTSRSNSANAMSKTEPHMRGCQFYVRRGLLVILLLPFALIAIGFVYETIMQTGDTERYPPPGQLVDVNGYAMHIYWMGEGSPTVILESGAGGFRYNIQPFKTNCVRILAFVPMTERAWAGVKAALKHARHGKLPMNFTRCWGMQESNHLTFS